MTSRIRAVTIAHDDESLESEGSLLLGSCPVETVMESFTHELDDLTRSLDEGPNLHDMVYCAQQESRTPSRRSARSPYGSGNRYGDYRTTPDMGRTIPTRTTPSEPLPVRTPPYNPRHSAAAAADANTYVRFDTTPSQENYYDGPTSRPRASSSPVGEKEVSGSSLTLILDSMRDTMDRQESRIRFLEQENEALRAEVDRSRRERRASTTYNVNNSHGPEPWERPSPTPGRSPRPFVHESRGGERPYRSTPSSRSPAPSTYSRRPREFTSPVTYRRSEQDGGRSERSNYSPGAKFVAELSNVMDLDSNYIAPLSVIMDKHLDRVNQIRTRHGWDR